MLDFWGNVSANEAEFMKDRHRTLPIPESISPVPSYPSKLRIYKNHASPFWQVQSFFKGKTYRRSTRTTNKAVAFRAAKEFFHLKVAELFGSHVPALLIAENAARGRFPCDKPFPEAMLDAYTRKAGRPVGSKRPKRINVRSA